MTNLTYAKNLCAAAEKFGEITVLSVFGNDLRVRIPMTQTLWNTSIDELHLTVRARNGLMRASAETIGRVSERIMAEGDLRKVRNLGKKSVAEIKTTILTAAYRQLTPAERLAFWQNFLQLNNLSLN